MAEGLTTKTAGVRSLEPYEDAEIVLFEAPFDGLIANVAFTPSEDLRGEYYTRQLSLNVHRDGARHHVVGSIELGTDEVLLPGGERHNARLLMPPSSLRVREGDSLVWSSIGSVGEGLEVPPSTVEVTFERKDIAEDAAPPELWRACVPDYWIGKKVWVEHRSSETPRPEHGSGAFSYYTWEHTGTFRGADSEVLQVTVDPIEHGVLPRNTGFPYEVATQLKLVEGLQNQQS